ncbi:MAG: NAD(P)H-hydrate dehydratase [Tissierellia bacterium]|nr:NAD(P)H-hydrate dehydratase [Tissierellia bacterium]
MSLKDFDDYILGIEEEATISEINKIPNVHLTEFNDIKNVLKKRSRNSHKGTYGKVGFVSGSKGMAGACVLNLNAALRCGSGLVKAFIPDDIYTVVESMSLEAITCTYNVNEISFEKLQEEIIDYSDVVATGSGCTNINDYVDILNYLLKNCTQPLIIDAEGINKLNLNNLKAHKQPVVLTPHYGEMAKLLNKDIDYIKTDIIEKSMDFSMEYNVYLVLKGARTIIACPDGHIYINTTGNPGMATAGSGDVLTGAVASFIGQGIEIKDALKVAVYLHGLAGDIGVKYVGEYSLTAGDIVTYLPHAIRMLTGLEDYFKTI